MAKATVIAATMILVRFAQTLGITNSMIITTLKKLRSIPGRP